VQTSGVAHLVSKDNRIVLEVAGRPLFELNPVGALIWERLATGVLPQDVADQLVSQFGIPKERATDDVADFVKRLKQHLLLCDDLPSGAK